MSSRWSTAHAADDARDQPREKFVFGEDPSHACLARMSAADIDALVSGVLGQGQDPILLWQIEQRVSRVAPQLSGSGRNLMTEICNALDRLEPSGVVIRYHYSTTESGQDEYGISDTAP
jgi:hypothetical protein